MADEKKAPINPLFRILPFLFIPPILYFFLEHKNWGNRIEEGFRPKEISAPLAIGKKAPSLLVPPEQSFTKNEFSLHSLKGYPIVLHFWATWCGPCLTELPELITLASNLRQEGFSVVAVAVDKDWETVERFFLKNPKLSAMKDSMVLLLDPKGQIAEKFGSTRFPETFLINRALLVDNKFTGPQAWLLPEMKPYLDRLKKDTP